MNFAERMKALSDHKLLSHHFIEGFIYLSTTDDKIYYVKRIDPPYISPCPPDIFEKLCSESNWQIEHSPHTTHGWKIIDDKLYPEWGKVGLGTWERKMRGLRLGPEHVGRKVRRRNGSIAIITLWEGDNPLPITCGHINYLENGKNGKSVCYGGDHHQYDIIEILEN